MEPRGEQVHGLRTGSRRFEGRDSYFYTSCGLSWREEESRRLAWGGGRGGEGVIRCILISTPTIA